MFTCIFLLLFFRQTIIIYINNCLSCTITQWTLPHHPHLHWTLPISRTFRGQRNQSHIIMTITFQTSDSSVKGLGGLMVIDHYHHLTDPGGHFLHGSIRRLVCCTPVCYCLVLWLSWSVTLWQKIYWHYVVIKWEILLWFGGFSWFLYYKEKKCWFKF